MKDNILIKEYEEKYKESVADLLLEEEKYIVDIDKDNLDTVSDDFKDKYIEKILRLVNDNRGKIYVAILDNKVVGMVAGNIIKQTEKDKLRQKDVLIGELLEISVSKEYQSIGIGKLLAKKMEEYLKKSGCEFVELSVFAYNTNAIEFYNKLGYHTRKTCAIKKIM